MVQIKADKNTNSKQNGGINMMNNFKFKNAVLPCNEKEDFNTTDISVDIICRIFLSEYLDVAKSKCF